MTKQRAALPKRSDFHFFWPLRVRYAEIDAQNVVFNAHYLTYFDVALTEACRVTGHDWMADMQQSGCDFQLVKSLVEYRQPLRFDDEFEVAVAISRLGRSSVSWQLSVWVADELYASGEIVWVYTDLKAGKSAPLTAEFKQLITERQLLLASANAL